MLTLCSSICKRPSHCRRRCILISSDSERVFHYRMPQISIRPNSSEECSRGTSFAELKSGGEIDTTTRIMQPKLATSVRENKTPSKTKRNRV